MELKQVSMDLAGREFKITNGPMVSYATGYAVVHYGDTIIMGNASMSPKGRDGADFFPMVVDYEENFFAAGKIKGSRFVKREGRPSENATLISRMIDRPLRPLFPKGTTNEVQIIATALSVDGETDPATTALNAASIALMMSGAPFEGPVGSVRIGHYDGQLVVNPTYDQVDNGKMDLVVAGTMDAITMVEAGMNELPEDIVLEALQLAHQEIKKICQLQLDYVAQFEIKKLEATIAEKNQSAYDAVEAFVSDEMIDAVNGKTKIIVKEKIHDIEDQLFAKYAAEIEVEQFSKSELGEALNYRLEKRMRHNILTKELRLDGRALTDVRPLSIIPDPLPRAHGSAIFQRGETMALTVATLGGPGDAQIVDTMERDITKRYFHHYKFPPYSTGDIKMLRGPGRREIGHGALAERALEPVLPSEADFPYTMWVHSQITKCNGSSSMASVCGSTLSLMCAGVPIKRPVAGIAMGLVMDPESGEAKILTDIQGMEDFAGDMDFKVTGTSEGLTALQMDIKVKGLPIELMRKALDQARAGRDVIMDAMLKAVPEPRHELSKYAPMIMSVQIDPDMIGKVIGKGGETIQKITKECEVEIDIADEGIVTITAPDQASGQKAKDWIAKLTYVPQVGDVFDGTVVRIMDFGAFVEIAPGLDGLVHISELANQRVNKVEDVVKMGDKLKVKLMKVDEKGRYNLSHKVLLDGAKPNKHPEDGFSGKGEGGRYQNAHDKENKVSETDISSDRGPEQGKGGHGEIVEGTQHVRKVNGA